ncbi:Uncharacterised protein [Vibrio cholerae]|nr:Uncharacterised protein [Vibrio cholerae]
MTNFLTMAKRSFGLVTLSSLLSPVRWTHALPAPCGLSVIPKYLEEALTRRSLSRKGIFAS